MWGEPESERIDCLLHWLHSWRKPKWRRRIRFRVQRVVNWLQTGSDCPLRQRLLKQQFGVGKVDRVKEVEVFTKLAVTDAESFGKSANR